MTSPFVRRRRLGRELRTLREERGLTADQLGKLIHYSRMQVSRLENGQVRPDIPDLIKILKVLDVTAEQRAHLIDIACDGAERGWWDKYGKAMGERQRLYANIESGAATIRGYSPSSVPGILQSLETITAMTEMIKDEGPVDFVPEKMIKARLQRQRIIMREGGPTCEIILDEIAVRRFTIPAQTMAAQLRHIVNTVSEQPNIRVRVLPVDAPVEGSPVATVPFFLYTFPDPDDPAMAVVETINTDLVHTEQRDVDRYVRRYDHLSRAALSPDESLPLLNEAADRLAEQTGSRA